MTFERDPLSADFDGQAAAVVSLAIRRYRRARGQRARWVEVYVPNRLTDFHTEGADRLSGTERAFLRALYHDQRIHRVRKNHGGRWSLERDWGPVPVLPGRPRLLRVRIWRDHEGREHAGRMPAAERWTDNPDLRSGGRGSPLQRFA
jgi:hypothetical protein